MWFFLDHKNLRIEYFRTSIFFAALENKGLVLKEAENKLGLQGSSTYNIIFENVVVSADNILGKIGKGVDIAFNILNIGRFMLVAAVLSRRKNVI